MSFLMHDAGSDDIRALLEKHPLLAPALIRCEVANGLLLAKRRQPLHCSIKVEATLDKEEMKALRILSQDYDSCHNSEIERRIRNKDFWEIHYD